MADGALVRPAPAATWARGWCPGSPARRSSRGEQRLPRPLPRFGFRHRLVSATVAKRRGSPPPSGTASMRCHPAMRGKWRCGKSITTATIAVIVGAGGAAPCRHRGRRPVPRGGPRPSSYPTCSDTGAAQGVCALPRQRRGRPWEWYAPGHGEGGPPVTSPPSTWMCREAIDAVIEPSTLPPFNRTPEGRSTSAASAGTPATMERAPVRRACYSADRIGP